MGEEVLISSRFCLGVRGVNSKGRLKSLVHLLGSFVPCFGTESLTVLCGLRVISYR